MSLGKTLISVLAISLPVLTWDFVSRVLPHTQDVQDKQFETGSASELRLMPSDRELSAVNKLLEDYKEPEKKEVKQPKRKVPVQPEVYIMPKDLQQQQNGVLESLYSGNIKYQLVATITHNDKAIALLQSEDLKTSSSALTRVTVGDELAEYTLIKVNSGQAVFNDNGRQVILRVFSKSAQKENKENA